MAVPESLATDSAIERDMATLNVSDSDFEHAKLAADLIERCNELLAELDEFQAYMKEKKKENAVNIGSHFSKEVQSELRRFKNVRSPSEAPITISAVHSISAIKKSDRFVASTGEFKKRTDLGRF